MKTPDPIEDGFNYLQSELLESNQSCTINPDKVEDRASMFESIKNQSNKISRSQGKIIFTFETDHTFAHKIVDFAIKERQCCNFFDFNLDFSANLDTFDFHVSSNSLNPERFEKIVTTMLEP